MAFSKAMRYRRLRRALLPPCQYENLSPERYILAPCLKTAIYRLINVFDFSHYNVQTPIMGICAIPQSTTILALTADGIVHTCDGENLQTQQLPFRHVVAISVSTPTATRPPRLAIAVRVNKRTAKFAVYDLSNINIAKTNLKQLWEVVIPDAPEIWGLAWANDSIIIASAHKYLLAAPSRDNKPTGIWRELLELPFIESEGQQPQRPFVAVQSLPWTQQALLAVVRVIFFNTYNIDIIY